MNIQDTIQSARHHHGAHRPFGAHMTKAPAKPTNPETLQICDDPMPASRVHTGKKYEALFAKMTLGQSIKCAPSEVGQVSGAMRKFLERNPSIKAVVRTVKNYGDGKGRVWMLAAKPVKQA